MKKVVVTGAGGFIGQNLIAHLNAVEGVEVYVVQRQDNAHLDAIVGDADIIFHLAGANRPESDQAFEDDNFVYTKTVFEARSKSSQKHFIFVYASSIQAQQDNAYGRSKLAAEDFLKQDNSVSLKVTYRLPGIFGKWCRPNYNSVVATFCYNAANGRALEVRDPGHNLRIGYIDDLVKDFLGLLTMPNDKKGFTFREFGPVYDVTLGKLANIIADFSQMRNNLYVANVQDEFIKKLYSTYLSYLPLDKFSYALNLREDQRGRLYEVVKSPQFGQIFISSTSPGITRGNHFHHTKTEKFLVVKGKGIVSLRHILTNEAIEYSVSGDMPTIVDIPPGYTHNITNIGEGEMITLFWANEIFDAENPDTIFQKV